MKNAVSPSCNCEKALAHVDGAARPDLEHAALGPREAVPRGGKFFQVPSKGRRQEWQRVEVFTEEPFDRLGRRRAEGVPCTAGKRVLRSAHLLTRPQQRGDVVRRQFAEPLECGRPGNARMQTG